MHDQRKVRGEIDEKVKQFEEEKIRQFRTVYDTIFDHYRRNDVTRDVLDLIDVLLKISPEQYTFFGYRRRILEASWRDAEAKLATLTLEHNQQTQSTLEGEGGDEAAAAAAAKVAEDIKSLMSLKPNDLKREYKLNTDVILDDMKVYSAFVHRRWIFQHMDAATRRELLKRELKTLEALLVKDERNFHAWGYRRFVTEQLRHALPLEGGGDAAALYTDQDEWAFTEAKVNRNFSNYSAWHNRGLLLERLIATPTSSATEIAEVVNRDITCTTNAFYVDENDQSMWLYAEFILRALQQRLFPSATDETNRVDQDDDRGVLLGVYRLSLETIIASCDALAEDVVSATITKEGDFMARGGSGAYVLWMQLTLVQQHFQDGISALTDDVQETVTGWGTPRSIVDRLITVDPLRAGMYPAML